MGLWACFLEKITLLCKRKLPGLGIRGKELHHRPVLEQAQGDSCCQGFAQRGSAWAVPVPGQNKIDLPSYLGR